MKMLHELLRAQDCARAILCNTMASAALLLRILRIIAVVVAIGPCEDDGSSHKASIKEDEVCRG